MTIREKDNYAEEFRCGIEGDEYVCGYFDNGQVLHGCSFAISRETMDEYIRGCIGYFPYDDWLTVVVTDKVFAELLGKLKYHD